MNKVVLIGLDGGNPNLVSQWIDELPNLRRFRNEGVSGKLESCVPAVTVPAWNCLFSGKNPGKLGLYDFNIIPHYAKDGLKPASYLSAHTEYLWDFLKSTGIRSLFVNVPILFPPPKIEGVVVSGGLLTPLSKGVTVTYPKEVWAQIDDIASGYEILPLTDLALKGMEEVYLRKLLENISKQTKVMKFLMSHYEWTFACYVFFVTDSVQHYFWHHMDESGSLRASKASAKWRDAIKLVYSSVDRSIGELMRSAPSETNYFIVSDHGSGPMYRRFRTNVWLRNNGFLSAPEPSFSIGQVMNRALTRVKDTFLRRFPDSAERIASSLPNSLLTRFTVRGTQSSSYREVVSKIIWNKTQAYAMGSSGGVYVNLRGREPLGIIEQKDYEAMRDLIITRLRSLRNPVDGGKMKIAVWKREDLYHGPQTHLAPDVVFVLDDYKYGQKVGLDTNLTWSPAETSGGHSMEGLFMGLGPDLARLEGTSASIYDITPTILHLMGVPIPEDVDGQVLHHVFRSDSPASKRHAIFRAPNRPSLSTAVYKADEEREISDRLRDLGYT